MNKTAIKNFAIWARVQLIEAAKQRAYEYEITENGENKSDVESIGGRVLSNTERNQRRQLIAQIQQKGYAQVMEEAAYTWFNRFIALRFMEVNGYLPAKIRIFTDDTGAFKPEILKQAMAVELDGLDRNTVLALLDAQANETLYKYLLITQCNALNASLPYMFEKIANWTELLFPTNLLRNDSVLGHMVSDIPEEDWQDAVQIIGWLYQYYNDERKNEVINIYKGTVKKEDIPAATQLFTTDWVVRYMVDNSLGRYWIERHPESKLAEKLEFFVTPKNGEIKHIDEFMKPEDIKFLDPCMGSGHILVYAFDVLMEIYKESGYTERDAAAMIVQNNLFGLDIDDRASQLAYFAVMMKARSYDRRFLSRGIKPNVLAIKESNGMGAAVRDGLTTDAAMNTIGRYLVDTFRNAKELGSIITVEPKDYDCYMEYLDNCDGEGQLTMEDADWLQNTRPMLKALARQAKVLAAKYPVVCTNPPYLNKIEGRLKTFMTENYKDYSGDLFSVFTYRNLMFCKQDGYCGYMTPFVWMFIKTYEKLREFIIQSKSITTLVQMEYSAFEEATVPICSFVLKNGKATVNGLYFKLSDFKGGMEVQKQKVLEALADKYCGYFYEADQSNFSVISSSPVAYWVSAKGFAAFEEKKVSDFYTVRNGISTGNNEKYLRLWHEVSIAREYWKPCNKGGSCRKWYGNNEYFVYWKNDGHEIKTSLDEKGRIKARLGGVEYSFEKGIEMSRITSGELSFRISEGGFVYESSTNDIYQVSNAYKLPWLLGYCNSKVVAFFLNLMNPTINIMPEDLRKLPCEKDDSEYLTDMVCDNIEYSKKDWDSYETSWDFKRNPLAVSSIPAVFGAEYCGKYVTRLEDHYYAWKNECKERFENLQINEEELNRIFIDIYGLQDELTPDVADKDVTVHRVFDSKDDVPESMKGSNYVRTMRDEIVSLISYAVGCMFGRYSLDVDGLAYAGGEWDASKYKTIIPDSDNIIPICDDEYFDDDITGRFVEFVRKVYGDDTLEENLKFVADALGGKGTPREVIRSYFLNDFYADHLKTYQKRPIYWMFSSGKKNGFKALCYMHRYQPDLLARLRTDYVHEQQERYSTQLQMLEDGVMAAAPSERIKLNKRIAKLKDQAFEIQKYEEKVHHLADQMISIDLDDGVKVNYAKFQEVLEKIK